MNFSIEYCTQCMESKETQDYWNVIRYTEKEGIKKNLECYKKTGDFFFIRNGSAHMKDMYGNDRPSNLCLLGSRSYIYADGCDDDIEFNIQNVSNMGRGGNWHLQKIIEDKKFYDNCIWIPRFDQILLLRGLKNKWNDNWKSGHKLGD